MEQQTPAFGKIYTVTSPAGCTVTDAATLKLLQTCPAGVQTPFVACGPSVIISDDSAIFAGPFDLARVPLGSSGGAGAPLTPDQLTAVENAVGGKLENVTIVAREATKATGWISSTAWSEIEVGGELFQINGTPFYSHGSTTTETLATAINETQAGLVTATADDANKISLESHNAGEHANTITLSTSNPNVYLSGDTLEGGQDAVKPSASLLVDNKGVHFSNVPDDAILYTGGMKIATQGGDIYHDDGSATFAGSYNGHIYSAVIDFKHFEVRRDGNLIVHFHESNGEPVLELNGKRALTEGNAYDMRRREQLLFREQSAPEVIDMLQYDVIGDEAEYILPKVVLSYQSKCKIVRLEKNIGYILAPAGVKRMTLAVSSFAQPASKTLHPVGEDTDFFIIGGVGMNLTDREDTSSSAFKFKSMDYTIYDTSIAYNNSTMAWFIIDARRVSGYKHFERPTVFRAPFLSSINAVSEFLSFSLRYDRTEGTTITECPKLSNLKVELPSMKSSFWFFGPIAKASGENLPSRYTNPSTQELLCGVRIQKDVLSYLWEHLPTANAGATISSCVDAALAHIDTDGTLIFDDADLAAAAAAVQAKGWTLNMTPIN